MIPNHVITPATSFGHHSGSIKKIPSILPDSYLYPQQTPSPTTPITPISISPVNKQILLYLLLKHYNMSLGASTPITTPEPILLYSPPSDPSFDYNSVPNLQYLQIPCQTADDHSLDRITQLSSLLLSAGSGSSLLSASTSISAPSSVPKPETAPMVIPNTIVPAKTPVAMPDTVVPAKAPIAVPSTTPVTTPTAAPSAVLATVPSIIQTIIPVDVPTVEPAIALIVPGGDYPVKPSTDKDLVDSFTVSYPNVEQSSSSALAEADTNVTLDIVSSSTTIASTMSLSPELSTPYPSSNSVAV